MSNILVDLVEHYRTATIEAIVKRDNEKIERYLSILTVLHYPTYLLIKTMLKKKSK
jgi:hypothetical protein